MWDREATAFVLRTPLLPLDVLAELNHGHDDGCAGEGAVADAPPRQSVTSAEASPDWEARLRGILARNDVQDAIFLASPEVAESLRDAVRKGEALHARLRCTLMSYVIRACCRPTPFGLFGGYSLGTIGNRTYLVIPPAQHGKRHTELHATTIAAIAERVAQRYTTNIRYCANSSLHRSGDSWMFVEGLGRDLDRRHNLVRITAQEPVTAIITAAHVPTHFSDLAAVASSTSPEWFPTPDSARELLQELIDCQVLESAVSPPATGAAPLEALIRELRFVPPAQEEYRTLRKLRATLRAPS